MDSIVRSSGLAPGVSTRETGERSSSIQSKGKNLALLAGKVALYAVVTIAAFAVFMAFTTIGLSHLGLGFKGSIMQIPVLAMVAGLGISDRFFYKSEQPIVFHLWDKFDDYAIKNWFHKIW